MNTFPGGKYDKSKSIFDQIENLYDDLLEKEKNLCIIILTQLYQMKKNIIHVNVHLILKHN